MFTKAYLRQMGTINSTSIKATTGETGVTLEQDTSPIRYTKYINAKLALLNYY